MNQAKPRVLSVGQCSMDHGNIARQLADFFDAEVTAAATSAQALDQIRDRSFDLILVNRVFDANGESGLELVRRLCADDASSKTPVMLVSNFADAQVSAQAAGAQRGFGKAALNHPETVELLRAALAQDKRALTANRKAP